MENNKESHAEQLRLLPADGNHRVTFLSGKNSGSDIFAANEASERLTEGDKGGDKPQPPMARSEIDDLDEDDDEGEVATKPFPGVDDGFYDNGDPPRDPDAEDFIPTIGPRAGGGDDPDEQDGPRRDLPPFPRGPGFDVESGVDSIPDINLYQNKKTLAQGMMDLALLSANANQLRYVLESFDRHPYYYTSIILVSLSLILQIAVGVGLIWNTRYNVKDEKEICKANRINNFTIIGIFLVTVINVFISAFGVATVAPTPPTPSPPIIVPPNSPR